MRTKVLICAAALAASLASSMAQNVYSLNVVGYVQYTVPAGLQTLVANPLDATMGGTVANGNTVSNLFNATTIPNIAFNSAIYQYNAAAGNYTTPILWKTLPTKQWSGGTGPTTVVSPGSSVLFKNTAGSDAVITFAGQVVQGAYTVATMPAGLSSLRGSPVPIGGNITNSTTAVGLVPTFNDAVYTFNPATGNYNSPALWKTLPSKQWSPAITINPAQGFLYKNSGGSANTWVSNFTVQ
jgi:hypothetical protein